MAIKRIDGYNYFGANYVYSASGLFYAMEHVQAGTLYIDAVGETQATGYFNPTYDGDVSLPDNIPHVQFVPTIDPSGYWYIVASGITSFTVRFQNTPIGDNFTTTPLAVGNWFAML